MKKLFDYLKNWHNVLKELYDLGRTTIIISDEEVDPTSDHLDRFLEFHPEY